MRVGCASGAQQRAAPKTIMATFLGRRSQKTCAHLTTNLDHGSHIINTLIVISTHGLSAPTTPAGALPSA